VPVIPGSKPSEVIARSALLGETNRVSIETPRLHGSIALSGGRIDDLTLIDYRETLDSNSPEIVLLSPKKNLLEHIMPNLVGLGLGEQKFQIKKVFGQAIEQP
jgi:YidC/Oxa1 family membrane protein insertase